MTSERPGKKNNRDDSKLRLLCVAAYLNDIPLAEQLLLEGVLPFETCDLFDSPLHLAAFARHETMFKTLQAHVPDVDVLRQLRIVPQYGWSGRAVPGAILGASEGGSLDMLLLALGIPGGKEGRSKSDIRLAVSPGGASLYYNGLFQSLDCAQSCTNSVEIVEYIDNILEISNSTRRTRLLNLNCQSGNIEIVRYLLDGDAGQYLKTDYDLPIAEACRRGHEHILDLLLERGVGPKYLGSPLDKPPLVHAAQRGHLKIARKLIDHGATVDIWPLVVAFKAENTTMVDFLLGHLPAFPKECGLLLISKLLEEGLESMVMWIPARGTEDWLHKLEQPVSSEMLGIAKRFDEEYSCT